uniref:Magnesium protoporphyrin IX methyltransferase, chloroplastic n=1 Tax=Noccaea caerulescens TaxID=107243 RepID=A0A1J3KAK5_NOCCA
MPIAPSLLSSSSSVSQFLPRFPNPTRFNVTSRSRAVTVVAASVTDIAGVDSTTIAVLGGGSVAALAAMVSLTDPERRRKLQAEEVGGGDKEVVREYFNSTGFERWRKIYGETDEVNRVQKDIRIGHAKTVENAMLMLTEEGSLAGVTVCDAGCGTGSLSIPLAKEGAIVSASDISAAMIAEAQMKAKQQLPAENLPRFEVNDLESLSGKYNTVVCLDVLIHYPQNKADGMIAHLASLAEKRVILSFAPKTFYYDILKRIGELFPGPSKATRAYLHSEADVERALRKVGWKITKRGLITTQFYFSRLIEAVPM